MVMLAVQSTQQPSVLQYNIKDLLVRVREIKETEKECERKRERGRWMIMLAVQSTQQPSVLPYTIKD